jgi:NAD(P)-dependent dehydrogenase (short-subunit alcohol dehydrogenase family)
MASEEKSSSRRRVLKDLTTGLLIASAAPAAFSQKNSATEPAVSMPNPATEYPKPPFPAQQQEWPGLVSKMTPRPDHGETSYKGSNRLAGRKALITGGDSGMGRAAAIAFAREGADVAINYLPQEESDAKEVVALIRGAGRKAVALPGDLREEAFCNRLVADAVNQLSGLDILVSNAARQVAQKSILDITTEQFDATFKTNVYAMFWITKAAIPHMKPGSSIICTTSINAYSPEPYILDYAATKGAIAIYVKALAKQMAKQGIRVNGVAPGPIWTPLQPSGGQLPDKLPTFGADTPMGRAGEPAELAPLYVLLAENKATYVTGQILGATGGLGGA